MKFACLFCRSPALAPETMVSVGSEANARRGAKWFPIPIPYAILPSPTTSWCVVTKDSDGDLRCFNGGLDGQHFSRVPLDDLMALHTNVR